MMYIDQDGKVFWLIPALIGAAIGAASYTVGVALSPGGFDNWSWGGFFQSIGIGAVSGAVTSGIGQIFQAGQIAGATLSLGEKISTEFGRGILHGMAQGGASALGGDDFLSGFASGALGSWAGSAFQSWKGVGNTRVGMYAFSGLSGGIGAAATGGNFWNGMASGLMVAGLNHASATWEIVASLKDKLPSYLGKAMENGDMGGCTYAVLKSIAEYLGIELPASFEILAEGADFAQLAEANGLSTIAITFDDIKMALRLNRPVAATYTEPGGKGHTVGIQAFERKVLPSGKVIRQRFKVMDPDVGRIVNKTYKIATEFSPNILRVLK